ncbi:Na+/H+ antiporter [Paenibacillus pectinilyticus]|uniref:Na+/H+ antiporter n=1 Tax=Paenibacillus pectinilyticus TaxID=512399 RepID=A0A1C1A4I0_9BACL|nr:Na+/H+ antiporter [Paenibacillus pectinilyticus]OCT15448.1 Na+/H+ antiporter [Paenibacillus pectinilyticus]
MELFIAVFIMISLIGASNVIGRFLPFIPVPLIQIGLGIIVALMPSGIHVELEPELFFVLFIAPLLYHDGKHISRNELWKLRAPIIALAVGLVFVTVFAVGYAINWMIPSIPLPAAFGLAAILSPTDAVAVGALAGRIHMPKTLMRLLEGEALMNDASGLVAFKFAIAAAVTGVFSLPKATGSFLLISIGGLLTGAIIAVLIIWLRVVLRRAGIQDVTMHMLIQILTPFLLYMIAEELGMSGILAAVAGGIMHAIERDRERTSMMKLNVVSNNTWSVILFILNGLVFVILGLQIPHVSNIIFADPAFNNFKMIGYGAIIFVMLIVLRFIWSFAFSNGSRLFGYNEEQTTPGFKMLVLTSISGVRGSVTLAGAFSIPLVLADGSPFPERNLIIFLAAAVILFSLITASVLLPLFSKKKEVPDMVEQENSDQRTQIQIMTAAIQAVHQESSEENEEAASAVIADYQQWIQEIRMNGIRRRNESHSQEKEIELRLLALSEERESMNTMLESGQISPEHAHQFFHMLDQVELILAKRFHYWRMMLKIVFDRFLALFKQKKVGFAMVSTDDLEILRNFKVRTCEAAINELEKVRCNENEHETTNVISHYHHLLDRLIRYSKTSSRQHKYFYEQKKELHWVAVQAERNVLQALYEKSEISRETVGRIRGIIREREASMFEQDELVER